MGKKSRSSSAAVAVAEHPAEVPVVGMREPCPCGSGRRYKACHGRAGRAESVRLGDAALRGTCPARPTGWRFARSSRPPRPPCGPRPSTAPATSPSRPCCRWHGRRCTVPTEPCSSASRLRAVRGTRAGTPRPRCSPRSRPSPGRRWRRGTCPGPGPRLQDVLEPGLPFDVDVHPGFDFWLAGVEEVTPEVRESLERANAAVVPTRRLTAVDGAYWCEVGSRRHLRWVLPQPEDRLLDALARLHAAERSVLVEGSRYVGAFRADGLLVPVWDLPAGHGRRRARGAGRRLRRATRGGSRRARAPDRGRAPGPRGRRQPPAHPALTDAGMSGQTGGFATGDPSTGGTRIGAATQVGVIVPAKDEAARIASTVAALVGVAGGGRRGRRGRRVHGRHRRAGPRGGCGRRPARPQPRKGRRPRDGRGSPRRARGALPRLGGRRRRYLGEQRRPAAAAGRRRPRGHGREHPGARRARPRRGGGPRHRRPAPAVAPGRRARLRGAARAARHRPGHGVDRHPAPVGDALPHPGGVRGRPPAGARVGRRDRA